MREFMQIVENATPILFHGSNAPVTDPFHAFSHFGTRKAALSRAAVVARGSTRKWNDGVWTNDLDAPIYLYPVEVKIKNPIRLPDLTGKHSGHTAGDFANLLPVREFSKDERRSYDYDTLAMILTNHGYDGVVYANAHEDAGSDSFVILSPSQAHARRPDVITLRDALLELGVPEAHFHA